MNPRVQHRRSLRYPIERLLLHLLFPALISGCVSPQLQDPAGEPGSARIDTEVAIMTDGYRLPLRHWGDASRPKILVLALHGFNDYGNAFAGLGRFLASQGVLTYAYDQRGFGATDQRGRWGGEERMIADLEMLAELLRERHPGIPLFLLGESMGGAIVIAGADAVTRANGIILIAPAVWSRDTMNPIQSLVLEVAAHTVPWLELSGRGLDIRPSDNLDMLHAFSADPLVIKATRIDALWGLTNVMDQAMAEAGGLSVPTLLLYGEHDEIIPENAFCALVNRIPERTQGFRIILYRKGWHMLTRDLQGERVMADIAAWLRDQDARLPSGEEVEPDSRRLRRFCRG
jgi:acylglycerol lipase